MRGIRYARPAVLALLGVAAALVFALPAAAGASTINYVSIGDSYTSAPGVLPYEESEQAEHCGRSTLNYPHQVAAALKLSLTDVSCGGAQTKDETESQFEGQPPQDDALSESTDVVTIGMGGNDGGLFGTLLAGCSKIDAEEGRPGKHPCQDEYEKYVAETFAADKPAQEASLDHIKELAPHAKVFVVGYPDITPKKGHCGVAFPWYEGDLKWFRNKVQKVGNKMIKSGAKAHGAIFVDTFKQSEEHNACTAVGTRWIEPIIGSLTGVPVHPNLLGEEADAYAVEKEMLNHGVRP
jgi:lysophospholipase L1-like esterase